MQSELTVGKSPDGSPAKIDPSVLLDHSLVIGAKGTGKTSLGRHLLDQVSELERPALVIDTTGDLTSDLMEDLGLPLLTGLGETPPHDERVRLRSIDLSLVESIFLRPADEEVSSDLLADELVELVAALLGLAGFRAKKLTPEFSLIEAIVWKAWTEGHDLRLADLIASIEAPPIDKIGLFPLDQVISAERRADLAGALAGPLRSLPPDSTEPPVPVDIQSLLRGPNGAGTCVFSFASGAARIQKFLVVTLVAKLRTYLAEADRSDGGLSALLYIDEAPNVLPAGRKAMTTKPLVSLLENGRRLGLGVVLVAEELEDVLDDVEDLCETWFVGNVPGSRARAAVVQNLDLVNPPIDEVALDKSIKMYTPGQFVLRSSRLNGLIEFELA